LQGLRLSLLISMRNMSHKTLGSFTITLLASTLLSIPSGEAQQVDSTTPVEPASVTGEATKTSSSTSSDKDPVSTKPFVSDSIPSHVSPERQEPSKISFEQKQPTVTAEPVKVGSQASQVAQNSDRESDQSVTKIHSHAVKGRQAATLYVRDIPVLTFLGEPTSTNQEVKLGSQASDAPVSAEKELEHDSMQPAVDTLLDVSQGLNQLTSETVKSDPAWKAALLAAKLNQLNREGVDASQITVRWKPPAKGKKSPQYVIKLGDSTLAVLDGKILSADAKSNSEAGALTATNRLRRLLGDAEPLSEVAGKPKPAAPKIARVLPSVMYQISGWASWYGPGFHGNRSASGEVFNQHAMTAAHPSLPFGTRVRVTNLNNGSSVIVRINDRGPYHGGRIIDLSMGAARVLGLTSSGVARVRVDVLGR